LIDHSTTAEVPLFFLFLALHHRVHRKRHDWLVRTAGIAASLVGNNIAPALLARAGNAPALLDWLVLGLETPALLDDFRAENGILARLLF
jgi:hypothetical protein